MARVHPIFANWTTGELSPLLYGRVDFEKYLSGARRVENLVPSPHGPVVRRAGTRFVSEVKDSSKRTYVIPFEFNTEQAYIIEFGHQYFRFYKDGGVIVTGGPPAPVEVAHVYTEAQLPEVKFIQSADTMYFFHSLVAPQKLTRTSHIAWTMKEVRFLPPATFETGVSPTTSITFGAVSGTGVSATTGVGVFLQADVGRLITVGDGRAIIVGFTSSTQVTVDIVDTLPSVGPHGSGTWKMEGSPVTSLDPSGDGGPVHSQTTLTAGVAAFRNEDVGKYIRINKGVCRIVQVVSSTVVTAEILARFSDGNSSPAGAWTLEMSAWDVGRYPRCGCFHEQRLIVAGSTFQPQTFWGSASGDIENFGLGPDDDDSFEFKMAANDVNTILWLVPTRALLLGTAASEFRAVGGNDNPITPTNVDVKSETAWGSTHLVRPVRIGHSGVFVTRSRREVRELLFSVERDSYVSNNLLLLAEHMTRDSGISDLAYQRVPHSIIWGVRDDGVLLSCTYQREHNVVAWARHFTGPDQPQDSSSPVKGQFESVAVIPHWNGDRDVAWFVVKRTINGATKRYVEHFDEVSGFYDKVYSDCSLTYSGAPATTISGLDHLEGEMVQILGDGAVYPDQIVDGGEVTLDPAASEIEIGLQFISTLETMDPEVPLQGTTQGRQKHWSEIIVRLDKTLGCHVNDEEIPFRATQDLMDAPPPLFTGDHRLSPNLNRGALGSIKVQQRQPLPLTVVAVFGTLGIGE